MSKLIVTGARQKKEASRVKEWLRGEAAVVMEYDTEKKTGEVIFEYEVPNEHRPASEFSHVFKSASLYENILLLCSPTEIIEFDISNRSIVKRITNTYFNDNHHAIKVGDEYYVVSTGLDSVLRVNGDGDLTQKYVLDSSILDKYGPQTDFRKLATTKPHAVHPNYVFEFGDKMWVTRFHNKDIYCIEDGQTVEIEAGNPHDGVVSETGIILTTTNGNVVFADIASASIERTIDLNKVRNEKRPLGWCRGVAIDDGSMMVGFSRLRKTRIKKNVAWIKSMVRSRSYGPLLSTRIDVIDLERQSFVESHELESWGMNELYSIHVVE